MNSVFVVMAHRAAYEYIVSIHRSIGSAMDKVARMRARYPDTRYYWEEELLWP